MSLKGPEKGCSMVNYVRRLAAVLSPSIRRPSPSYVSWTACRPFLTLNVVNAILKVLVVTSCAWTHFWLGKIDSNSGHMCCTFLFTVQYQKLDCLWKRHHRNGPSVTMNRVLTKKLA